MNGQVKSLFMLQLEIPLPETGIKNEKIWGEISN